LLAGIWVVAGQGIEALNQYREEKTMWAYNKDYFQRALLRRDWYLKREGASVLTTGGDLAMHAHLAPRMQLIRLRLATAATHRRGNKGRAVGG
jgi:hypothetical protein